LDECRLEIVESALAGPQEGFGTVEAHPTLAAKVAILAYRLIKGHACSDGNKRLALILSSAFLEANGHDLEVSGEETDHVFRRVAGSASEDYDDTLALLTHWFEQTMRPLAEEG
jgi:death-on-curing protein